MSSSLNFGFLENYDPQLAKKGATAEQILKDDPKSCIATLRIYAEDLSKLVGQKSGFPKRDGENQKYFLLRLKDEEVLEPTIWSLFEQLRSKGNKAVHSQQPKKTQNKALQKSNARQDSKNALIYLKYARDLGEWFHQEYGTNTDRPLKSFISPLDLNLKFDQLSSLNYTYGIQGRDHHNFWMIKGIAGSGKTYIAMREAERLSTLGCKVLVLVFNEAIARYLRKELEQPDKQISVYNYHALCAHVFLNIVGYPWALPKDLEAQKAYCRDYTPQLLEKALDEIEAPESPFNYDVIIIDEGQDFHPHWWNGILRLAKHETPKYFYFFYDPDQNYQDVDQQANVDVLKEAIKEKTNQQFQERRLYNNCRNTKKIATKIYNMFNIEFEQSTIEKLPDGDQEPQEKCFSNSQDERKWIEKIIKSLKNRGVQNRQIGIISLYHFNNSIFKKNPFIGDGEVFNDEEPENKKHFPFVTARRVKGLEYDYVIVTGFRKLKDLGKDDPRRLLLYLSASRARKELYLAYRDKNYRFRN